MKISDLCRLSAAVVAALALSTSNVANAQWGGLFGGGGQSGMRGGHNDGGHGGHGDHGNHGNNGWGNSHWNWHGDHWDHNDHYHHNHNWGNNNYNNNYRPRNYSNYSEPTYSKPKTTKKVTTKSNSAPKAKPKPTIANAMKNEVARLTKEEFEAARDALQAETDTARALLQGDIGQGVNNKAIADLLTEAELATQNGGPLPLDWQNRYEQAVADAGIQTGPNFQRDLDGFVGIANANATFGQGGFNSNTPSFPTGIVNCILMPVLPADEVCMVRADCCMIGTGGTGSIGVVECGASELIDMPIGEGEPNPDSTIEYENGADEGVLIINPPENDTEIHFVLDNKSYDLETNDSRNFVGKDSWEIRFNRGNSKKEARYTIEPGTYVFTPGDNGWELFRRKIKVSVTNSGQDEFNYVAGNEQVTVEPGETLTHSSAYPFFIRFDRGNGEESTKRIIESNAKLAVAVDPKEGAWDLYAADQVESSTFASTESKANVGKSSRAALFNNMARKAGSTSGSRSARLLALMKDADNSADAPAPVAAAVLPAAAVVPAPAAEEALDQAFVPAN